MTPTELIAAAELYAGETDDLSPLWDSANLPEIVRAMSRHVLATVRADDDESVSMFSERSTDMLTDERLNEIEARTAAATPGPWKPKYPVGDDFRAVRIFADTTYLASVCNSDMDEDEIKANAELIAHARKDIPDLVAEVRRLRELIDDYLHYVEQTAGCVAEKGVAGHFGTEELIERLREQLRKETT